MVGCLLANWYNVNTGETPCYQIPKVRETFPVFHAFQSRDVLDCAQPKEFRFMNLHQLQIWLVVATHLKKNQSNCKSSPNRDKKKIIFETSTWKSMIKTSLWASFPQNYRCTCYVFRMKVRGFPEKLYGNGYLHFECQM